MARLTGPPRARFQRVHERGIATAFREIHERYVELLTDPARATEALKRALFLQWYAEQEPPSATGIWDLDEEARDAVILELDRRVRSGEIDPELRDMLARYYREAPWYFDGQEEGQDLKPYLRDVGGPGDGGPSAAVRADEGRGLMGEYWRTPGPGP